MFTCTDEPEHGKTLLGVLDYAWLFPYAIAMFFRYVVNNLFVNNYVLSFR